GSTDQTASVAANLGAVVVHEPSKGYGSACLKGIEYISHQDTHPDIVVFLDGDYSDFPQDMESIIEPIISRGVDMVIGSRALGNKEKGAMMPQQIFGNWLATTLIRGLYRTHFTDLGPFRAIKYNNLMDLKMSDKTFGWTVEMQVKAAKMGLKTAEVPVRYRKRIGESKVSGTIKGTILAGYKILWTIFKLIG
ncbi:MAG: glycosyltransferase family 2 protein, partial [Saprospiraceae bacterium]